MRRVTDVPLPSQPVEPVTLTLNNIGIATSPGSVAVELEPNSRVIAKNAWIRDFGGDVDNAEAWRGDDGENEWRVYSARHAGGLEQTTAEVRPRTPVTTIPTKRER